MRIAFIVFNIDGMGGTSRSAITQANALAPHQDVRIVSVTRSGDRPHYDIDPRIPVDYLVDVRDPKKPAAVPEGSRRRGRGGRAASPGVGAGAEPVGQAVHRAVRRRDGGGAPDPRRRRGGDGHPRPPGRRDRPAARPGGRRAPGAPVVVRPFAWAGAAAQLRPARRRRGDADPADRGLAARPARPAVPPDRGDAEPAAAGVPPPLPARQPADPDGRPARAGEAVPVAGRGVRRDRRPDPRLAAADLWHRPGALRAGPRDPQVGALGPRRASRRRLRHGRRVGEGIGRGADVPHRGIPAGGAGGDGRRGAGRQLRLRRRGRARSSSTRSTGCWSVRSRWPGCRPRCSG